MRLFLYYSQSESTVSGYNGYTTPREWVSEKWREIHIDLSIASELIISCQLPSVVIALGLVDGCCWRCRLTDSICSRRRIISPQQPFNYCDGRQFGRTYQLSMQNTDRYRHRWVLGSVVISHILWHITQLLIGQTILFESEEAFMYLRHTPYVTLMHKLIQW